MPLQYKRGECSQCHSKDVYIVKKMPSGSYCMLCNQTRLMKGKEENPFKHKPIKKKKATGEMVLFELIWATTPNKVCEVCGTKVEFAPVTFSHILSKGSHPAFRLLKENVRLMCFDCHYKWDNVAKSELTGPKWDSIKELATRLKEAYNKK